MIIKWVNLTKTCNFSLIVRLDASLIYTELTNRSKFSSVHDQYTLHSILIFSLVIKLLTIIQLLYAILPVILVASSISKIWLFFCEHVVKKNEMYFGVKIFRIPILKRWRENIESTNVKDITTSRLRNVRHLRISNDKDSPCKNLTN